MRQSSGHRRQRLRVRLDGTGKPENGHDAREARELIRNYFEEFVNEKNVQVGNLNFAAYFVDHRADVPPGPAGAIAYGSGGSGNSQICM